MIQVEPVAAEGPVLRLRMARTILGRPLYYTTAYWIDGLLIDTGCAHTAGQLRSVVKGWTIDQIINTHSHEDHIGANASLQEIFCCPVLAHPDALPILRDPRRQPLQAYRRLFWGQPAPCQPDPIDDWVSTERFRFRIIHTPGHSPGHICLFAPEQGWLFSGDAYIGGQDRALRQGYDIHSILASLHKLSQLPIQTIFSASGSVRSDGRRHLEEKVDHLRELERRIELLWRQGLSTRRIRRRVIGREPVVAYLTLGHFSARRLIESYIEGFSSPEPATETTQPDADKESNSPPL